MDFLGVAGVEALAHAQHDAGATVHVHQQVAGGGIHAQTFDLALLDGFVEDLFHVHMGVAVRGDVDAVQVVGLVVVGGAVVSGHEQGAVVVEHALHPLRHGLQMHLAQVVALEVVFIQMTAAFFAHPGAHPHGLLDRVHGDAGHFFLAGLGLELERALEFQGVGVMDGDLDVLAHAVHEVFGAHIDLAVVDVDVTDVVGGDGVAFEGIFVLGHQFAVHVVLVQGLAAAHIDELAVAGHALATGHGHDAFQGVGVLGTGKGLGLGGGQGHAQSAKHCQGSEQTFHLIFLLLWTGSLTVLFPLVAR